MVLLEATIALSIITVIGLVLFKLSMNILHPRMSIIHETLADSYMTYERSFAERVPFDELKGPESEWPEFPETSTTQEVELGLMPGGHAVLGTVTRTRIPDDNNDLGDGTEPSDINPAAMEIWRVQSVLTYQINGRNYAKSRTVIRSQ